jgi:hypothetical protein
VKLPRLIALAATLFIIITLSFQILSIPRQEAYLALDINPSLLVSLDEEAIVVKAQPLNQEAERLLQNLHLPGKSAEEAIGLILEEAFLYNYLRPSEDNAICISLAAPENYLLTEDDLRLLASEKVMSLGISTYLKIKEMKIDQAEEGIKNNISLNRLILQDELIKKGVPGELVLTSPLRVVLEQAGLENIFTQDEFIAGQRGTGKNFEYSEPPESSPGFEEQGKYQLQQGDNQRTVEQKKPEEEEKENNNGNGSRKGGNTSSTGKNGNGSGSH